MQLHPSAMKIVLGIYFATFTIAVVYAVNLLPVPEEIQAEESSQIDTDDSAPIKPESPDEGKIRYLASPNFAKQNIPDYDPETTFKVPPGMEFRVNFWKEIYGKYTTDQIVIHDTKWLVIYTHVDISDLNRQKNLSEGNKQRIKNRRINSVKEEISKVLLEIHKNRQDPSKLSPTASLLYQKFKHAKGNDIFYEASRLRNIRAQVGQKDQFIQGIYFAGRYLDQMEEIFARMGMPIELTRLPFVESSFNLRARSRVGASGIWQFIRSTGKLFMRVDSLVDERNDPITSTVAAAKLLKINYEMLQSWPLAVTAYNHGPAGMRKAAVRSGTKDIVWITNNYESRTFGFASKNFYAEFLAALEVQTHYERYFGKLPVADPVEFDTVKMVKPISLSSLIIYTRLNKEILQFLNPALTKEVWGGRNLIPTGYDLRIPEGGKERFLARLKGVPSNERSTTGSGVKYYTVQGGDNLISIAEDHDVTVESIREANDLSGSRIRAGQVLVIP